MVISSSPPNGDPHAKFPWPRTCGYGQSPGAFGICPLAFSASPWLRIYEVAARCFLSCQPIQAHAFCAGPTLRHLHQHSKGNHSLLLPHKFVCTAAKFLERLHMSLSPSTAIIAYFLFLT